LGFYFSRQSASNLGAISETGTGAKARLQKASVWLERSIDAEHYTGGTAVSYSSKKVQELMNKARVAKP
jgi:hypothetical protein